METSPIAGKSWQPSHDPFHRRDKSRKEREGEGRGNL